MKISLLSTVLLCSIAAGQSQQDQDAPGCALDCVSSLADQHLHNDINTICGNTTKQRALFQCLLSSCQSQYYDQALAYIVSTCSNVGADISPLHPVELHHVGHGGRHVLSDARSAVLARASVDEDSLALKFNQKFSLAVDCNAGLDGVLTLSLPASGSSVTTLPESRSGLTDPNHGPDSPDSAAPDEGVLQDSKGNNTNSDCESDISRSNITRRPSSSTSIGRPHAHCTCEKRSSAAQAQSLSTVSSHSIKTTDCEETRTLPNKTTLLSRISSSSASSATPANNNAKSSVSSPSTERCSETAAAAASRGSLLSTTTSTSSSVTTTRSAAPSSPSHETTSEPCSHIDSTSFSVFTMSSSTSCSSSAASAVTCTDKSTMTNRSSSTIVTRISTSLATFARGETTSCSVQTKSRMSRSQGITTITLLSSSVSVAVVTTLSSSTSAYITISANPSSVRPLPAYSFLSVVSSAPPSSSTLFTSSSPTTSSSISSSIWSTPPVYQPLPAYTYATPPAYGIPSSQASLQKFGTSNTVSGSSSRSSSAPGIYGQGAVTAVTGSPVGQSNGVFDVFGLFGKKAPSITQESTTPIDSPSTETDVVESTYIAAHSPLSMLWTRSSNSSHLESISRTHSARKTDTAEKTAASSPPSPPPQTTSDETSSDNAMSFMNSAGDAMEPIMVNVISSVGNHIESTVGAV